MVLQVMRNLTKGEIKQGPLDNSWDLKDRVTDEIWSKKGDFDAMWNVQA